MKRTRNQIIGVSVIVACIFGTTIFANNPKQEKKITITLSEQEWNVVLQGLSELPMKTSSNVYQSIIQQAQYQLQSQQPPKRDTTTKKH